MQQMGQDWKTLCLANNIKMDNNEFKNVRIKNRTCYYYDVIIKFEHFDFDNILIDEKSHEIILIYDISYETLIGTKLLHIRFNKINGFIRVYGGTIYSILFGLEKYDAIYNRIRYFIRQKVVSYIFLLIIL